MKTRYSVNLRHIALYPRDCFCEVATVNGSGAFSIIALFMNGIRLKADAPGATGIIHHGQEALVNILFPIEGLECGGFPCRVKSVDDREAFLAFGAPLHIPFLATVRDNPRYFA